MSTQPAAQDTPLEELDIFDPTLFEDGPPHELFARLRAEAPVRWNAFADGSAVWTVTRHADVRAVSRDTDTFSSSYKGIFLHPDQVAQLDLLRDVLLYKDPPEHTKYRLILQKAFTPNTVAKLEDAIRSRVTTTIDRVIEQGHCDFQADIAVPIPLAVLAELMGVPDEDIDQFYTWTEEIEAAQRSTEPAAAVETFMHMAGYLNEQIDRQSEAGNEDSLVMRLRAAEVDGEQLDDNEILLFFGLLAFAGNDTTRNTTATGMLALLEHPEQLQKLKDDPSLIEGAIEEVLRWTSVVQYFARTATTDTEIAGTKIAEGDKVVIWYASASRDDEINPRAEEFDVTRDKVEHAAFGGGGRHFCLGAGLARLELKLIFEQVLARMGDIELDGDVERVASPWAHMLKQLPVRFTPGKPTG